ncbi:MAG: NADPH-dependent F420 reductase [Nitrososphaeria archaeon]
MKIAILGGTGDLGKGLALRLSLKNDVVVGSREREKAQRLASEYLEEGRKHGLELRISGATNQEAIDQSSVIIVSVPHEVLPQFLPSLRGYEGKLVISPVVPMTKTKRGFEYVIYRDQDGELSAAELIAKSMKGAQVASAFHTVPAVKLSDLGQRLDYDVLVAADDRATYDKAAEVISSIEGLRPYYAGRLYVSRYLESLTPLLLNVAINNRLHAPSIRIV